MLLFVRNPLRTLIFNLEDSTTVLQLKHAVAEQTGLSVSSQRLSFGGVELMDSCALSSYDIDDLNPLDLNCDLLGGGKKRKKKAYTTPKKIKHKKKKVKLATLKYYKVDSNGKITRLRRECPSKDCGPGVFMASHFDRQYCGKCAVTYMHERK